MAMMMNQRAQLLQNLGNIATSAANSAAQGITEATKTDPKTVDTALKLFGGFDRSEFENLSGSPVPDDGMPNLLVPTVRPPASYEGPAEYFKPLSNNTQGQSLLVPVKELHQQLQDPGFRMSDGLSGFTDNRITETLAQNKNGINILDNKSAAPSDMLDSLNSFGKLYRMEDTVGKQLQLHQQFDFGALGKFSAAPKQASPPMVDNPKLHPGLKGLPDIQAATQPHEIVNLFDYAMNATPQTMKEMGQMVDVLLAKVQQLKNGGSQNPFVSDQLYTKTCLALEQNLLYLKQVCGNHPPNLKPHSSLLEYLQMTRQIMQQRLL